MSDVKHNGCANCGSRDQQILRSVLDLWQNNSAALCSVCEHRWVKEGRASVRRAS